MRWTLLAVVLGFLLDLCFGDPRWLYHPVRIIGKGITFLEKILRNIFPKTKTGERIAGGFLVVGIVAASSFVPWLILHLAYGFRTWLGVALESFMCYQLLAARSLRDESKKVYDALQTGDIEKSRYAVSMIVGRDTQNLTEEGVTKAAVETVAENTSDGIIAPLFYMMIGGAVLGFAYKSVNTMDSMVGYKNDRYLYFGRTAAKLDDIVNYIPARISALLMVVSCFLCGKEFDGKRAWYIFKRDRYRHASPNSAQTEAVCAGALGIRLAGNASYFGKIVEKPYIGDAERAVETEDIKRADRLLYATAVLCEAICLFVLLVILLIS